MYHTHMKQILLTIYILLTFSFIVKTKAYAQEDININTQTVVEQEEKTLEESLQTTTAQKLTAPQILLSILAPTSLVVIGYLLIKKLKL